MGKMEPTARGLYRMRTFPVLGFLDCMVMTVIDYLLIYDDNLFHTVNKSPSDSTAVTGINEAILRTCIKSISAIHEFRMKNYITLLRSRFHIRQPLPIDKILRAGHAC